MSSLVLLSLLLHMLCVPGSVESQHTNQDTTDRGNVTNYKEGMAEPPFHKIRKCCPVGQVLDDYYACVSAGGENDQFMAKVSNLTRQHIPGDIYQDVLSITGLGCSYGLVSEFMGVRLFKDGTVLVFSQGRKKISTAVPLVLRKVLAQ